jgi:hypothetical protein
MSTGHVGVWLTSRIELRDGELVTVQSFGFRRSALGGWISGMLYLTTLRLLWTPSWYSLGLGRRSLETSDVKSVSLVDTGIRALPNRWTARVNLGKREEQFGFGGLPTERQKGVAESWVQAIKEWANL